MNPKEFLESIYLGDRACKALLIDSWNNRVAIQVDLISRLRPGSKTWDFYTEANIKDGWLVFSDVRSLRFEPAGPLPNAYINGLSVQLIEVVGGKRCCLFEPSIDSVDESGNYTEVLVRIEASRVHLEDPSKPGMEIVARVETGLEVTAPPHDVVMLFIVVDLKTNRLKSVENKSQPFFKRCPRACIIGR